MIFIIVTVPVWRRSVSSCVVRPLFCLGLSVVWRVHNWTGTAWACVFTADGSWPRSLPGIRSWCPEKCECRCLCQPVCREGLIGTICTFRGHENCSFLIVIKLLLIIPISWSAGVSFFSTRLFLAFSHTQNTVFFFLKTISSLVL